jgi:ABC-type dipeptide/oligopeptide/nickel transport system ATPase component
MMDSGSEPLLAIRDLRTWFETPVGRVRAVEGVSLDVREHQAVGIVGESGSGKTQTFFSVLGLSQGWPGVVGGSARFGGTDLLQGLDGHVEIGLTGTHGEPVVRKNAQRWNAIHHERLAPILGKHIAMMFQDPRRSLVPYWTIRKHLAHVLRRGNAGADHEGEAAELLSRFGFRQPRNILDAFPEQLSGGEAQRAMLALTMAMKPRLLIADEPTTALDAINQQRVLEELGRIHAESEVSLVLISHDLAVVRRVAAYVFVLFGGHVVERAPASFLKGGAGGSLHPYTLELRESQRRRAEGLPIVATPLENGAALRLAGCPYAGRCALRPRLDAHVRARCDAEFPAEVQVATDHFLACWGLAS